MKDDLIKRSDVECWILTETASLDTPADRDYVVEQMRYSIPAVDAVEVVRCRECEHWRRYENSPADCDMNMIRMGPEDYCSYGQRREEDDGDV